MNNIGLNFTGAKVKKFDKIINLNFSDGSKKIYEMTKNHCNIKRIRPSGERIENNHVMECTVNDGFRSLGVSLRDALKYGPKNTDYYNAIRQNIIKPQKTSIFSRLKNIILERYSAQ